jgi:putative restriction endonuclease
VLANEFSFDGVRVPLLGQTGIWKPRVLDLPLSIATSWRTPYDDELRPDGTLNYAYRGTDRNQADNVRLRQAFHRGVPLIYFHGVDRGRYIATWPVYIVADDPALLRVSVVVDQPERIDPDLPEPVVESARRAYYTIAAKRRLHQASFRHRVLRAYRQRCTICRLKHTELLDAAHIVADSDPLGEPIVPNGLAMCKIHHAAFDRNILGIRPDHVIELREDILEEIDGPMLEHGLQRFQHQPIVLPAAAGDRPRSDLLEIRYEAFRQAS